MWKVAAASLLLVTVPALAQDGAHTAPQWQGVEPAQTPGPDREPALGPILAGAPGVPGPKPGPGSQLLHLRDSGQWTPDLVRTLTQVLWGEAGIGDEPDHRIILWVLLRRWSAANRRRKSEGRDPVTFGTVARAYSAAMRPSLRTEARESAARRRGDRSEVRRIQRRRFLAGVEANGANIRELARLHNLRGSPDRMLSGWLRLSELVRDWGAGYIPDPCPAAMHWDMTSSAPAPTLRRVCLGVQTRNAFYSVRPPQTPQQ